MFCAARRCMISSLTALQPTSDRMEDVTLGILLNIVLISTYELGRQPFGLASPAAWLRARGHGVTCLDLSREALDEAAIRAADLIAFYVPMHTATRLAAGLIAAVRGMNSKAHLCFYGLYAPVNEQYLRGWVWARFSAANLKKDLRVSPSVWTTRRKTGQTRHSERSEE